jgi:gluconolactonase
MPFRPVIDGASILRAGDEQTVMDRKRTPNEAIGAQLLAFVITLVVLFASASALQAAEVGADAPAPRRVSLDPEFDRLVPEGTVIETVATGFRWLEGPAWHRREGTLYFSDIPRNAIFRWRGDGVAELFLTPSGYSGAAPFAGAEPGSNGLLFDAAGRLVICQHGDRRIARLESDGTLTVLVDRYDGRRLNSPNDAVYRSNGDLYFTDPPFGLPGTFTDPGKELPVNGVYRLNASGTVTLLIADIKAPNGIAFSPDEKTLYITDVDAERPAWLAYDVLSDGTVSNGRIFADANPFTRRWHGAPDGLDLDAGGNLFAAGPGGVYVFNASGTLLGMIETGVATSNVAWGGDGSTLYITAGDSIYRLRTRTRGAGW